MLMLRFSTILASVSLAIGLVLAGLSLADVMPRAMFPYLVAAIVLTTLLLIGTFLLAHLRLHRLAVRFFLFGTLLYIALLVFLFGGATQLTPLTYVIPVMVAGLFGGSRGGLWLFICAAACYTAQAGAELAGLYQPPVVLGETNQLLVSVLIFFVAGGMMAYQAYLWSSSTRLFMSQIGEQSEALFGSNEKLLQKNIQQIEIGNELSVASAELLAASHQQASGATEQASAVSQISTTIEELGATARQIAISAEQVAHAAQQTLENLSEGQGAVDAGIQAMERIRGRMRDVTQRVLSLGERSQQIGEIIDLINDLSDETHLLALNAAIEAAGAGEHGRRFAVVAAEVKSLANRALAAAKEVKGVIAEIQQATNTAVLAAEEGGKEVERGVEQSHNAGQVMDSIVMVAERTAQSASEISMATAQQQSASEQVVETMREVAEVARQTAAGARQMSESAQMLSAIAERLHGITGTSIIGGLDNGYGSRHGEFAGSERLNGRYG
ncbi:MAG: methyl-accepting chemotaxis protein [Roseiflexaceae bacterium]|nr:methyl-accepting chemotaxis protein [Roseiflexaceae bacterium]